jgi:drug/metabolite transporter (DMT)-like permease
LPHITVPPSHEANISVPPSPDQGSLRDAPPLNVAWYTVAMPGLFVFLWSTGFIGAKFGLPYIEPMTFLAIRFAIVCALLALVGIIFRAPWPKDWRLAGHIVVAGLLVQATYLGGVFTAIDSGTPAGIAALITGLQPIITALLARRLFGEIVTPRQWSGIALGFIGIVMVLLPGLRIDISGWPGLVLSTVAVLGITAGTLYQKKFCGQMDLRTGSAIQFFVAGIVFFLLSMAFETQTIEWVPELFFAIGWLVIVLSMGAISLLFILIRRGAAAKLASLFYLVTPVTALLAFLMFGETLGVVEIFGMLLTAVGVALVVRD